MVEEHSTLTLHHSLIKLVQMTNISVVRESHIKYIYIILYDINNTVTLIERGRES